MFGWAHPATPRQDADQLRWQVVTERSDRVRVVEWTCPCHHPVYELCSSGGLLFIRRWDSANWVESDRWRLHEAREMWDKLLAGACR
ncbi:hypothetical protein Misp01_46750 [Microtetraspora sp. NBRC 13810]|nr:hypothetical protein Misp01_46750 [Microtetraspora sp. NBRC 13810]